MFVSVQRQVRIFQPRGSVAWIIAGLKLPDDWRSMPSPRVPAIEVWSWESEEEAEEETDKAYDKEVELMEDEAADDAEQNVDDIRRCNLTLASARAELQALFVCCRFVGL